MNVETTKPFWVTAIKRYYLKKISKQNTFTIFKGLIKAIKTEEEHKYALIKFLRNWTVVILLTIWIVLQL
jgi:hypothetical protein